MTPAESNPNAPHAAVSGEDDSLQREIAYVETWLAYRPAVAPIVLSRLGELGRELQADLPRLMAERKVKANVARLRAERLKRDRTREAASVAAMIVTAPSLVIAAPAAAVAESQEFQVASGEQAATGSLLLCVMDSLTGKPLPGVRLMTVSQEVVAVTNALGQAPVPAKFASEGVLSLERDGYPIVLLQGSKLASRSLVAMRPFSQGPATATRKKPATTAKAKSTGPIVKIPAPPTPSALDEAMAVLRGAPNAPDDLAAVTPAPAPVAQAALDGDYGPIAPPPAPVAEVPVVASAPAAPALVAEAAPIAPVAPAPVPQAALDGDYGPVAAPPVQMAASPTQVAPEPPHPVVVKAPVVALKKATPRTAPKAAKPAPAKAPMVAVKPAKSAAKPVIAAVPVVPAQAGAQPAPRPLLPIAPPIVSVSDLQKLASAVPADELYGPATEAPAPVAVAVAPAAEAPKPAAKPAPVVALKKSARSTKAVLAVQPKAPPVVEAPKPAPVVVATQPELPTETFGPEPEVRPALPLMPAPPLPVVAEAAPVEPAVAMVPVSEPVPAAPVEAPVVAEAPVAPPAAPVEPKLYSIASAETTPAPSEKDVYGPNTVAQAPVVEVPNAHADEPVRHETPMTRPAAAREPVATHVAPTSVKAVVVPKKALKPKGEKPAYYKVRPGDSLSAIARDLLGDMMRWPELYAANRDQLTHPSWLPIGLTLKLPRAGEAYATAKKTYVVRHGDSLSLIAKRQLGDLKKWPAIYAANRNAIADPTLIFPGQRLVLPVPMANAMPPLSWANLQASHAPSGMGGHEAGDEPKLALGGVIKYGQPESGWAPLASE